MEITEEALEKLTAERDYYKLKSEEQKKALFYGKIDLEVNQSHLQRLIELARNLTSHLDLNEIGEILLENIEQILNYDIGYLYNLKENTLSLCVLRNHSEVTIKNNLEIDITSDEFYKKTIKDKKPILVTGILEDGIVERMGIPIVFNNEVLAIVVLESKLSGVFSQEEVTIASNIVETAAIAIENANLFTKFQEKTTQLIKTLGKLKTTQEQLISNEKMVAIGRLASGLAHEINSPLAGMLTTAQLIKLSVEDIDDVEIKTELNDSLDTIESGIKKIRDIVSNFLVYTSKETEIRKVALQEIVSDAVSTIKKDMEKHNITIEQSIDTGIELTCNKLEITNMAINVLLNAKDAVVKKSIDVKYIGIRGFKRNKNIVIEIEDNGIGIKHEDLSKVFEPFFTTKGVGGGKGLGLTVSYEIAKKYYGNIKIESAFGVGTKIIMEIEDKSSR